MDARATQYRLPGSIITTTGTRTIIDNPVHDPREITTRVTEIGLEITADATAPQRLLLSTGEWSKRSATVQLKPDGRLSAVNSSSEEQSGNRWKSALSIGTSTFGTLAPIIGSSMGPVGLALAAAAGLATAIGTKAVSVSGLGAQELAHTQRPSPAALGIHGRYVRDHPEEAELLADLRFSQALLEVRRAKATHARASADTVSLVNDLRNIAKALQIVKTGLEEAEARYARWIAGHQTTKHEDHYHRVFMINELPTEKSLREAAANGFAYLGTAQGPGWPRLFENLRVAVSVDLLGPAGTSPVREPDAEHDGPEAASMLTYRQPQVARITQWNVERGQDQGYQLTRQLTETKVVVPPGTERHLPLLQENGKRIMSVRFDDDGLLSEISYEHTDARVQRFHELREAPGIIADGLESGARLAKGWQSATDEFLKGPDPMKQLREELEEAELRARLARARVIISEPTRALTLFYERGWGERGE